jgi:hypothetical protein
VNNEWQNGMDLGGMCFNSALFLYNWANWIQEKEKRKEKS